MKPSGIITLTTDFGLGDPYAAMMKGVILSINPRAKLVDITHLIRAGAIRQASSVIHETFSYFPRGTVHLGVVDPGVGNDRRLIALEAGKHYFVGPDNGLFSPVIANDPTSRIFHLTERQYFLPRITNTFHGREIIAPVSAHISLGVPLDRVGLPIQDPIKLTAPLPHQKAGILYGQITHVDNFGNCTTNVHKNLLENFLESTHPVIEIGNLNIKGLNITYSEAEEGQPLALINSSDWLEIAINMGRASEYLGMNTEELIGKVVKISRSGGPVIRGFSPIET